MKLYYIGLDVHKKVIQYCIKLADGQIVREGRIRATRAALAEWVGSLDQPWKAALEATMFSAWIYDALKPHAVELKVAHSAMLKAIATSKHASDRLDARHIADLVRMDWIPGVWMAPPQMRALRLQLRYRNLVVRQATQTKNRIASTLMEQGVEYSKARLHGKRYFQQLLERLDEAPEPVRELLRYSRASLEMFQATQRSLLKGLGANPELAERVRLLQTIPGVGEITALSWALEIGDPHRFRSADRAMSYCGLVAAQQESAGKQYRQPLSKKRNAHLQRVLIEAAHLAPRYHPRLRQLYERVRHREHTGAAVVAVARKLVSYLLAVDKSRRPFQPREEEFAPSSPAGSVCGPPAPPIENAGLAHRSSPSRVRTAALAQAPAPWTAAGRRASSRPAMGGSGGKQTPAVD
jgi:transposase